MSVHLQTQFQLANIVLQCKLIVLLLFSPFSKLGFTLDNALTWKTHIDILMPKLSTACYALRMLKQTVSQDIRIYYAYCHSLMNYGIIFWSNSNYSGKVFKLQKRVVRIRPGSVSKDSGHDLFKNLNILTLLSQYISSLLHFVITNRDQYMFNSEIHGRNTRQIIHFH